MGGGNGEGGGNGDGGGEGKRDIIIFSVRSVESGGRGKRILKIFPIGLPKEEFKRVGQLCGKERDKKEDTKRHSTRRKEHTDTVYA